MSKSNARNKTTLRYAPYFPFYAKEWLIARHELTVKERGALINLWCYAWNSDQPGSVADDDRTLARQSGLGKNWQAHKEIIRGQFEVREGRLWARDLEELYEEMTAKSARRSANGAKGAKKRWQNMPEDEDDDISFG